MAKNLGTFTFAANFQVKAAEALDPRMVAASKADLITKENWPHDGDTIYVYKGLIVDCGDDGVYRLVDPTKALASDYSGWERIDAGGVHVDNIFTYKHSVASYDMLPVVNVIGDVYNVEAPFSIGEGDNKKDYPAGTNVAWTGEGWDPLAGSVDLSNYAAKGEVAEVRATANTAAQNVANLSASLGAINESLSKKVDAEEGKELISSDKLQLIDTHSSQIGALLEVDSTFDNRLKAIERAFTGEGGTIDLGEITGQLTEHGTRLVTLETDNAQTKNLVGALMTFKTDTESQINAIVELNTQQTGQIAGLTEELTTVKNTVASHTNDLISLNTTVGQHTDSIATLRTDLEALAVKSISDSDKVLSVSSEGALSTTLALNSYKDETDGKTYVALTGIEGALISRFDASAFVRDGMLDSAVYESESKNMILTFNTDSGKQPITIPMSGLVDTYTAGTGLSLVDNQFSANLSTSENNRLTLANDGSLLVDISEDVAALESSMDSKIDAAFSWIDVQ